MNNFTFPLVTPEPWTEHAECRNMPTEIFYPKRGESTNEAKAVCADCQVRVECLQYALDHHEAFGTWGGLSTRERTNIIRAQKRRAS